jgi:N-acetylglucosaminyl-diphospho-decaprenol L-rhamnosyltransferase
LNDDLIFGNLLIETLVRAHKMHPMALIGSVESVQDTEDIICNGGIVINWWIAKGRKLNAGRSLRKFPAGHTVKVSYLNGRGILFPIRVFREIGLFDARYVHLGDFEYGVRAKKQGYQLLRTYDAVVYHYSDNPRGITKSAYRWSDLRAYLTDERSYANIRNLVLNSILCTKNPLQGISFFLFAVIRTLGHFIKGIYFAKA